MKINMQKTIVYLVITLGLIAGCVKQVGLNEGIAYFKAERYRSAFIKLKPEAEKGQPDAEYAIAYMYYYGLGVTEDRKHAWLWLNRAAQLGQPDAVTAVRLLTHKTTK